MKGPVCVYSSGDTEVKTKSLAESIGVGTSSTKTEKIESTAAVTQPEATPENRTDSSDNSGGCRTVSEELAKFAVITVQSQSTESFSAAVNTLYTDAKIDDKQWAPKPENEGKFGTNFLKGGRMNIGDWKNEDNADFSNEMESSEQFEGVVRKRKLSEDDVPKDFTLKVSLNFLLSFFRRSRFEEKRREEKRREEKRREEKRREEKRREEKRREEKRREKK